MDPHLEVLEPKIDVNDTIICSNRRHPLVQFPPGLASPPCPPAHPPRRPCLSVPSGSHNTSWKGLGPHTAWRERRANRRPRGVHLRSTAAWVRRTGRRHRGGDPTRLTRAPSHGGDSSFLPLLRYLWFRPPFLVGNTVRSVVCCAYSREGT